MPADISELDKRAAVSANDEDSARARTRVSRACTRCRTRKDKCDGLKPCTACQSTGSVCQYDAPTKKRGLPEGYVRGLEKLFALLMYKVDGFENITSSLLSDHRNELIKIWNHTTVGEDLHTTWKESRIIQELETLLSGLDQSSVTVGQKRKRERDDDAIATESEPNLTFHTESKFAISLAGQIPAVSTKNDKPGDETALPLLPPDALHMLDHYFAHTHCWFPVLHRPQLTRACYELSRGRLTDTNQVTIPLLWAIFAYTSSQLRSKEKLSRSAESPQEIVSIKEMRSRSLTSMPHDAEAFTTVHAQAFLILALSDIGLGHWKSAWIHIGQAVRIALSNVAPKNSSSNSVSGLIQGCVILDVAIASHLGCVPHLRRSDIDPSTFMNEDGHEEWEPWNAPQIVHNLQREPSFSMSCFNRLTEVYLTISDVLGIGRQSDKLSAPLVQDLLAKLHHIQSTFPGRMPPSSQSPPHQIYLQLCHVSAQIRLVQLPVDSGAGLQERAKLACNVISLLALCRNSSTIGLRYVPPFLVDGVESALKLAESSKLSFNSLIGLAPFEDFCKTAGDYLQEMCSVWPVYTSAMMIFDNVTQMSVPLIDPFTPSLDTQRSASSIQQGMTPRLGQLHSPMDWQKPHSLSSRHSAEFQILQNGMPSTDRRESNNLQDVGSANNTTILDNFLDSPLETRERGLNQSNPNQNAVLDDTRYGIMSNDFMMPGNLGIPGTSPSFQGDEIDAIFHEMAHLDTNEWSNERVSGLKDFGFADDMTFRAFCNDPERLLEFPLGAQQTLSSESQTWTLAGTDPL